MKLIRLKINKEGGFRSLQQGFEIYFLRDFDYQYVNEFNPTILAGRNGSGKSNVMEALANIFYNLDYIYSDYIPDGFLKENGEYENGFDGKKCLVDAYELEYFIDFPAFLMNSNVKISENKVHIKVTKEIGEYPIIEWLNINEFYDDTKIPSIGRKERQKLLPSYVLGYSSGENELLSLPFYKTRFRHYDEYVDKTIRNEKYGYPPKPEGRLVYLDAQFSQAILLTNLLMQNEATLEAFKEVDLIGVDKFRLIVCLDKFLLLHDDVIRDRVLSIDELHGNPFEDNYMQKVDLVKNLDKSIENLKKCSTCFYYKYVDQGEDKKDRKYLILDYKVNSATKEAFSFYFSSNPLELFQLFQILLELNAYIVSDEDKERVYNSENVFINQDIYPNPLEDDRILRFKDFEIRKKGVDNSIYTKQLSDGEHQFLHSLGLCLLFKDEECLFLLDEPETHFNPDWKAKFITSIRNCIFKEKSYCLPEMLISTHSSFLISDSESRNVHIFERNRENGEISCMFPEFQTLGTSVNKIAIKIFDKADTIGVYANSKIDNLRKEFEGTEDKKKFIEKVSREIGDSVEKVLFINELLDKIEEK